MNFTNCNKTDNKGYNCDNGNCIAAFENPQYLSLSDCQSVCSKGNNTTGYNCVNNNCLPVNTNPQYTSITACESVCKNGNTTLGIPTQILPANGAKNIWSPFTYSWSNVTGATGYDLEGYYFSSNNQQGGFGINYNLSSNSFNYTNQLTSSWKGKVIYWRVRAKNNSETGQWSPTWTYTLNY